MSDMSGNATLVSASAMLRAQPVLVKFAFVAVASLLLAASSWIAVPFWPVPMTMQTYAVLLVGAVAGSRLGTAAVLLWLFEAFCGLPFLSEGHAGPAWFVGPTAGYLAGFVISAALAGYAAERGWLQSWPKAALALLVAHLVVFVPGLAWLTHFLGDFSKAVAAGWVPFIPGTVLKTALAVVSIMAVQRVLTRRNDAV
jgi:biotin transport system substrate-specific component